MKHFKYLGWGTTYIGWIPLLHWPKLNKFLTSIEHSIDANKMKTEIRFHKDIPVLVLMYGSETLLAKNVQENRMQRNGVKFLRREKGCIRSDWIQNKPIRKELKIFKITVKITKYRIKWNDHLKRMNPDRWKTNKCQQRRSTDGPRKK